MKLTKALKEKGKLIQKANEAFNRFNSNNSSLDTVNTDYDPKKQFDLYIKYTEELVSLKSKIQIANGPILHKIYRLSELKNLINRLKSVDCKRGTFNDYRGGVIINNNYTSWLSNLDKDNMISSYETEIEKLQEEIDYFNATTEI